MIEQAVSAAVFRDLSDVSELNWKRVMETRRPYHEEVQIYTFPQTWGSTALGYGGIGGAAMSTAQTVVVVSQNEACVYFGCPRLAYKVKCTQAFFDDMRAYNLADVARAEGKYEVK